MVLALLAPGSAPLADGRVFILRLPYRTPVSVSLANSIVTVCFNNSQQSRPERTKVLYDTIVREVMSSNVLVFKLLNFLPSAISDAALAELGARLECVLMKTRVWEDRTMGACDATVTALVPRWDPTLLEWIEVQFEQLLHRGSIRLCESCKRFFAAARDAPDCIDGRPHKPYTNQYTTMSVYPRPVSQVPAGPR
jgi:hypothetical protein